MNWKVPFFRHDLGQAELDSVANILAGPILTTGDATAEFEQRFADLFGCSHAVATKSGTAALNLTLLALGIGPGDEVITTPMSWIATAAAILQVGARPVFVDVEDDTGNLDTTRIEAAITSRTRAIVPVHLYGLMCDMQALRSIADHHGLRLIEDAAHCIEGVRDSIRPGQLSDAACFSFYTTKSITCGEGGAVICNDHALRDRLRLLRLQGITIDGAGRARDGYRPWDMIELGYKENMSNIEAALLLPQLNRMVQKHQRRCQLAETYAQALRSVAGVTVPSSRPNTVHGRHLFTIWVDGHPRDELIGELHAKSIACVVNYLPIHLQSYFVKRFGYARGTFPSAERIGDRTVSLPFYPDMPVQHVELVVDAIAQALGRGCAH